MRRAAGAWGWLLLGAAGFAVLPWSAIGGRGFFAFQWLAAYPLAPASAPALVQLLWHGRLWLLPLLLLLLVFGGLIVLAKGSAIAPFIYTIF
jgi:iron(III) transport system permease protein